MKAVRYTQYGPSDLLKVEEVEKPSPQENEILIQVHAASINAMEWRVMTFNPILARVIGGGLQRPKDPRFGTDLAGTVEAAGAGVTQFRPGDAVFGCATGAFAEYVLARESHLAAKPANVSFEQAAAVPVAALTALQGIRWAGGIRPGQKVLIQGASGGVGTYAVQLAKCYGAEVTAVCSTRNQEMARSMGAEHVIDYTKEDFTRSGLRYDLIFAINGYHSIFAYQRALAPQGVYVCAGGAMAQIMQAALGRWMSKRGGKRLGMMGIAKINHADLAILAEFLEAGSITPFIDRTYALDETAAAMRYVEDTHPQGKVVLTVA